MMLRFETILNTYSTDSSPQQIANMTLTVVTIRVIRFRTPSTPREWRKVNSAQRYVKIIFQSQIVTSVGPYDKPNCLRREGGCGGRQGQFEPNMLRNTSF